jgi:molybdate transport system substrate-binding protein
MSSPYPLYLLGGGAAQGLVAQVKPRFEEMHPCVIKSQFGAVGFMLDRMLDGEPCDVIVLTQALIAQLTDLGDAHADTARALGVVKTGVAVKSGGQAPPVDTPEALKAALLAANGIYLPDPVKSTAGVHFMKVLRHLGVDGELSSRLRPFPNGATAMRAMAASPDEGLIGCTQVTEILYTPGVELVARLPKEFELATVYTAAINASSNSRKLATELIDLLSAPDSAQIRRDAGFE